MSEERSNTEGSQESEKPASNPKPKNNRWQLIGKGLQQLKGLINCLHLFSPCDQKVKCSSLGRGRGGRHSNKRCPGAFALRELDDHSLPILVGRKFFKRGGQSCLVDFYCFSGSFQLGQKTPELQPGHQRVDRAVCDRRNELVLKVGYCLFVTRLICPF